ncbi:hypothetical protein ACFQI5_13540 [Mammaliicoccus vitulinus]|uniref:hypothetical protein n=1 Tax=Mammaliicoccus vitulinus TaxID=71237 RepID=UPI00361929A8
MDAADRFRAAFAFLVALVVSVARLEHHRIRGVRPGRPRPGTSGPETDGGGGRGDRLQRRPRRPVEQYGIGGVLYATFLEVISAIQSFGGTITAPFRAFGSGLADLVAAAFPVRIVNEAADFTAFSITRGEWSIFGPFTFAVGIAATLAGLWVFLEIIRRIDLSLFGALLDRR